MHIHFDPLGGWSGDMFAAALLDAFPQHRPAVESAVVGLDLGPAARIALVAHDDGVLTGRRFIVAGGAGEAEMLSDAPHDHRHDRDERAAAAHRHRAWSDIRDMLARSSLADGIKAHALGIFRLLAQAEAEVHGVAEDAVTFHEVGAVDSIVDIVAAAVLVDALGPSTFSSAPLPLGSGRIRTQHGPLPVPAPAAVALMRGLVTIDDGVPGERVTPTGAAIARHLLLRPAQAPARRRLERAGTGFGSRTLPGLSNCLRVLVFIPEATPEQAPAAPGAAGFAHRELGVIAFEVDDQSAEDLANGLDRIRELPGIHDVVQLCAFGKKGRIATQVQVLAAPDAMDAAIAACFAETTTIGLRFHTVRGAALPRVSETVEVDGKMLRVKLVARPDGTVTGKTEAADVAGERGHAARARLRREAESLAASGYHRLASQRPRGDRP